MFSTKRPSVLLNIRSILLFDTFHFTSIEPKTRFYNHIIFQTHESGADSDYICLLHSFIYSATCFNRDILKICRCLRRRQFFFVHRNNKPTFKHFSFHTCLKLLFFAELCSIYLKNFRGGRPVSEISKQ
jgi:hypothetical protein